MTVAVSDTVKALVEGLAFFGPLLFFVIILIRGSRSRPPPDDDDGSDGTSGP